jgi:hypothetical protein
MVVLYSLWSFGIFFSTLVCLHQEKSGNPVSIHFEDGADAAGSTGKSVPEEAMQSNKSRGTGPML